MIEPSLDLMMNERKQSVGRIPSGKSRIFIIDDQPIIRERLTELIDQQPDLVTCGEGEDTRVAMDRIEHVKPDLVITGLSFKHSHGLGLIKELRKRFPRLP